MKNIPEDAKILLDALTCSGHVATGLSEIRDRWVDGKTNLRKEDVSNMELYVDTLHYIEEVGRDRVQHVCPGRSYALKGYDKLANEDRKKEEEDPRSSAPYFIKKLKQFRAACKKGFRKKKPQTPAPSLPPANEATRSSKRQKKTVTPDKPTEEILKEFNGQPRFPDKKWTKATLCKALKELDQINSKRKEMNEPVLISPSKFMENIVESKKSTYKDRSGIQRMYTKWVNSEDGKVPEGRGRPSAFNLDVMEEIVKNKMKECTSDSSRFKVEHMEEVFREKAMNEAEQHGLDSETVKCTVTDATMKTAMMAVAMKGDESGIGMSNKKLATKTEKRFQAEHSIMGAYAYAATVLSTHFVEGPRPYSLRKYQPMNLSDEAKQTVEWVREAFGADEVHPVDPNLVLSTDDTTLFVFEGATNDDCVDKWEWKLYDKTEPASSVHSDFQVGDDVQMSGGLRVRLTFTFTASGLAAPPYVAVSGLTEEELSPALCEDGILAEKIPGLCKGGDDLFNEGFGWLVFLRADRKNNTKEQEEAVLSIANKKFMHYNDKVLLPFIRSIREKLGWKKGQQIPDYLKACSWFDGDIGQLQTMIDEAREALDEAEKICRNKHSAASTGRQQPADLTPVFRLIKAFQLKALLCFWFLHDQEVGSSQLHLSAVCHSTLFL